jgi:pilus assembly protein CpaE
MRDELTTLLLGTDASIRAAVRGRLSTIGAAPVVCTEGRLADGLRLAEETNAEVVAVVMDDDPGAALALIEELAHHVPSAHVFALSWDASPATAVRAMRAGASEFLGLPLDATETLRALVKVTALRRLARPTHAPAEMWTVYAPKGGAGVTTLAVNLALEAQAAGRRSVCLVDLDFQSSDVVLFLNLNPLHSVLEATSNVRRLDPVFLQGTLTRHTSGVYVLAGPPPTAGTTSVPIEHVRAVLDLLRTMCDVVVVDTPRALAGETLAAFSAASRILLLLELTLPFLRGYRRTMEVLDRLGVPAERIDVVVAKHGGARAVMPLNEATTTLGLPVTHVLPRDDEAALGALDKGAPLGDVRPGSPLRLAIASLARALLGGDGMAEERRRGWRARGLLGGLFAP